jgi:hypothetical protein
MALVSSGLAGSGCDAQVDPTYRGEPLLTISGRVESALSAGDVEVGVLWLTPTSEQLEIEGECFIELSAEPPGPCAAACGTPSCDDVLAFNAWSQCADACDGPTGIDFSFVNVRLGREGLLFAGAVGKTVPAQGEFPAQFHLDVLEPPPEDVLIRSSTGERIAAGLFVALDPAGAPFVLAQDEPGAPPWLLGGSNSHLLMFAPDGVSRGSDWGKLLSLEVEPGLRLLEIVLVAAEEEVVGDDVSADVAEEDLAEEYVPVQDSEAAEVRLIVADPTTFRWPFNYLLRRD